MEGEKGINKGNWDAIHIVACNMKENPKVSYRVISTVMVTVDADSDKLGKMDIAGSSAKSTQEQHTLPDNFGSKDCDPDMFHLSIIGRIIEANEEVLRNNVQEAYITKNREITNTGRLLEQYMSKDEKRAFQEELAAAQAAIAAKKKAETGEVFNS